MSLISDDDQQTIREHFDQNLTGAVEVVMFTERKSPLIIPGHEPCEMRMGKRASRKAYFRRARRDF